MRTVARRRVPIAALLLAAPLFVFAGPQPPGAAGVIEGRVHLAGPSTAPVRRPGVADLVAPRAQALPDVNRAVVYLASAPTGAFDAPAPGRARMDQRNETFVPHVLAIAAGTVVDFPNSDAFYHNVFSLSKPRRFDLGRYPAGKSASVRFDRPGIVRVFCEIHSHMNAFILVFAHPFFAVTDAEGDYRIDEVPPGAYDVVAWSEGTTTAPHPVTVSAGGRAELDFTVR